jgi:hypothetical protein
MNGCAGVLGLFLLLVAGAGDEQVWKYFGPPILTGLSIAAVIVIGAFAWNKAMRGLR